MDCCGGISFTDDDELESDLALGGVGPSSSSSSSSITIGELRDPMPTMAMMGESKGVACLHCRAESTHQRCFTLRNLGLIGNLPPSKERFDELVFIRQRETDLL